MRSMSVAATGMMAQQLNVEVISNNIANMTTTGFKRRRPEFQDLLYQSSATDRRRVLADGTIVPAGVQLGLGVKTASVYRVLEQGNLVKTENRSRPRGPGRRLLRRRVADRASSAIPAPAISS